MEKLNKMLEGGEVEENKEEGLVLPDDDDIPIEQMFMNDAVDEVIAETFVKYDTGSKGYLEKDEARRFIAESLGLPNPESTDRDVTLSQFIKNMDVDGCQHISQTDMTTFIKKQMDRAKKEDAFKKQDYRQNVLGMDVDEKGNQYVALREEIPFSALHSFVVELKNYAIIFDNTALGQVSNAFNYFEMLFDMQEGLQTIKNRKTTKDNVIELLRRRLVGAARCGKKLIINVDKHILDFNNEWTSSTKIFDSSRVFDRPTWKDTPTYHMQIVQKDENYDSMMTMGSYHMQQNFEVIVLCRYQNDDQVKKVMAGIPHSDKMRVVHITD